MKTLIYKSREEFDAREDRSLNGVSEQFAKANRDYEAQNENNSGCYDCSGCSDCSRCYRCSYCSDCSRCSGCSRCSRCSGLTNVHTAIKPSADIPKIDNIHQRVYEAVTGTPDALEMSTWHTCGTTHCRGGWVVTLAGDAGKALEMFHGTLLAAQLIYRESGCPINPARFFDSNEDALDDMRKLAEATK